MEVHHKPYKIDSFYHFPYRDVIGFHFTLNPKAVDVPEVIVNLLNVFSVNELTIIGFDISQVNPQKHWGLHIRRRNWKENRLQ